MRARSELRSDAEDCVDEVALRYRIAFGNPPDLTFADCMHGLVTLNRSSRPLRRSEAEARRDSLVNEAMDLLDDVVQIWRRSAPTPAAELTRLLQVGEGAGIRRMPIPFALLVCAKPEGQPRHTHRLLSRS